MHKNHSNLLLRGAVMSQMTVISHADTKVSRLFIAFLFSSFMGLSIYLLLTFLLLLPYILNSLCFIIYHTVCVCILLVWQSTWNKPTYVRKRFIFKVLEISVHDQLAPLVWGMWQGSASWWEPVVEEAAHLLATRKQKEEWKSPTVSFQGLAMTQDPMQGPPTKGSHTAQ